MKIVPFLIPVSNVHMTMQEGNQWNFIRNRR